MMRSIGNCQRCHKKTREEVYCLECQRWLQMQEIVDTWDEGEPDEQRTQAIDRRDREKSDAGLE